MTRPPLPISKMPFEKYVPTLPLVLADRTWPSRQLAAAPRWCSVDLRDGNQALIDPMGPDRKLSLFETLLAIGLKEIEVGFPSASVPDYEFVRHIIEHDLVPSDVSVQVLVQCRAELIERTFEAVRGAPRAIVHFYNSTSELQRRVVFRQERDGIMGIATSAARLCRQLEKKLDGTELRYEYSPESFTGTEPDFALQICEAVAEVIEPTAAAPLVLNLPSTVEMYSPNVFADVVEWFGRELSQRGSFVLSVHPHNDRGTAVAAAELACWPAPTASKAPSSATANAPATLTSSPWRSTCSRRGSTPGWTSTISTPSGGWPSTLPACRFTRVTHMPASLVYTAFSGLSPGRDQKGMTALPAGYDKWEVPYLPIDPKHTGRTYEAIIRVNSQSGKGGVAYIMGAEHGLDLPRRLQVEFSRAVQAVTEASGTEIKPSELWEVFEKTYLAHDAGLRLLGTEVTTERSGDSNITKVVAQLLVEGEHRSAVGQGNGPIDAFVNALRQVDVELSVLDYHQHALTAGSGASSVAYVEAGSGDAVVWGVGLDSSILDASLQAVISAANRLHTQPTDETG